MKNFLEEKSNSDCLLEDFIKINNEQVTIIYVTKKKNTLCVSANMTLFLLVCLNLLKLLTTVVSDHFFNNNDY